MKTKRFSRLFQTEPSKKELVPYCRCEGLNAEGMKGFSKFEKHSHFDKTGTMGGSRYSPFPEGGPLPNNTPPPHPSPGFCLRMGGGRAQPRTSHQPSLDEKGSLRTPPYGGRGVWGGEKSPCEGNVSPIQKKTTSLRVHLFPI